MENIFIGKDTGQKCGGKCFLLGAYSGMDLKPEDSNKFRYTNTELGELVEYRTDLTDEEADVLWNVFSRAIKNKVKVEVPDLLNETVTI